MLQSVFQFVERTNFDLDYLLAAAVLVSPFQCGRDPAGQCDVIVLDEHAIRQIQAVVVSAAAAYRIFVEHAQSGRGFSRVQDARGSAGHYVDEFASKGGDATQPLHEIQNHALTGEHHAGVMPDNRHRLAFVQANSVENFGMSGDFVVRSDCAVEIRINVEDARHTTDAGENAILFGKDGSRGALIRIYTGVAGGIARGPVLLQRVFDDGGNASAVPVHDLVVGRWSLVVTRWSIGSLQFFQFALRF